MIYDKPYDSQRRIVGYVPQRGSVDWDFPTNVLDVVMMGRYGALGWVRRPGKKERELAMQALEKSVWKRIPPAKSVNSLVANNNATFFLHAHSFKMLQSI